MVSLAKAIVVMGVSGCGKTTVGQMVARQLGYSFYDGDDFHPPENVAHMAQGIPLTDTDRAPYMKANMLQSQFEALEPPDPAETITISVTLAPAEVVNRIVTALSL